MKKILMALAAIFGIAGIALAFGGGMGMMQGEMQASHEQIPDEIRLEFMEATHTGDYETAKVLSDEYGIGGKRMRFADEELFTLRYQRFEALKAGNYEEALSLQDQMRDYMQDKKAELIESGEFQGMRAKGMGKNMGVQGQKHFNGECPHMTN
jgi:hypothetical protein